MRDEINSKDELLKFVFFPSWVIRSARYNERSLSSLLDIQTLHSFLPVEDISVIFVLNEMLSDMIEDKTAINTLLNEWSGSSIFLHTVEPTIEPARQVIMDRLFDESLKDDKDGVAFSLFELTKDVFGVCINPGYFCGDTKNHDVASLRRAILERAYSQEPLHRVVSRGVFASFFKNLTTQA